MKAGYGGKKIKSEASDFFISTKTKPIALCDELNKYLDNPVFASHFKDIVENCKRRNKNSNFD